MTSYVIDISIVDTTPGNSSPFSPPIDWSGNFDDYLHWLRSRYRVDCFVRQRLGIAAKHYQQRRHQTFQGPYTKVLVEILDAINKKV